MDIATIASKKACAGSGDGVNTGKKGCLSLFGTPTHLMGVSSAYEIPANTVFDISFLTTAVQNGTIVPLIDASGFEDVSAEDGYSTNSKGIKRFNLPGLPEYRLMFEEGHEFYREMDKLKGYKNYNWILGDESGNWMLVKRANGAFAGFTGGHTTPELTSRKVEGGDAESKSLLIQFLNRLEWDRNYEILHIENLDFIPQEVPVIHGVELSFDGGAPAATDTTFTIKAVLASDRSTPVTGLIVDDFYYTVNGTEVVPSGITETATPGIYEFTVAAVSAAEELLVDTQDASANSRVALNNGNLYRAVELAEATVVA